MSTTKRTGSGDRTAALPRNVRIGIAGWDDASLVESGAFYPRSCAGTEDRLAHCARQFRLLELDFADTPPTERVVERWTDSTPEGFVLDVAAFRLLTLHPTPLDAFWPDLRSGLAPSLREQRSIQARDLPVGLLDDALDRFLAALEPMTRFGKLGVVRFCFPPSFAPSQESLDYLVWLRQRAGDVRLAVEFRNREWLASGQRDKTMAFLEEHRLAYVCVDEPQGFPSSVPAVTAVTSDIAVVHFHGRNADTWEREDLADSERYAYAYRRADLEPWAARIQKLAATGRPVHVVMGNRHRDEAVRAARLLRRVLTEPAEQRDETPRRPPAKKSRGQYRRRPR